jgi:hypothetical protein
MLLCVDNSKIFLLARVRRKTRIAAIRIPVFGRARCRLRNALQKGHL